MKKIILIFALTPFIFISCTKKEEKQINTEVDYKAPGLKIYGKWKVVGGANYNSNESQYIIFEEASNLSYYLTSDDVGFHEFESEAIWADASTIKLSYYNFKYERNGDSLILNYGPNKIAYSMVAITDPAIDPKTWVKKLKSLKAIKAPNETFELSFGVNGDILYISAHPYTNYNIYRFNTLNGMLQDSVDVLGGHSAYFKSAGNELFIGRGYATGNLKKTTNFTSSSIFSNASINTLSSVRALSFNGSSGTLYAYTSANKLFAGSDGGNFSELADLSGKDASGLVYAGNDEFYCIINSYLCKVKISPTFQVIETYGNDNISSVRSIGSDGTNLWIFGYNYDLDAYAFTKISL